MKCPFPPHNWKQGFILELQVERLPQIHVTTREEAQVSNRNLRGTLSFWPQQKKKHVLPPNLKMKANLPVLTLEESRDPPPPTPCNVKGGMIHLEQHEQYPEIPVTTQEES